MAANADIVLRKYYPGTDKTATVRQLERAFIAKGYGLARARKWIEWFTEYGILTRTGKDEDGNILLTCLWWR